MRLPIMSALYKAVLRRPLKETLGNVEFKHFLAIKRTEIFFLAQSVADIVCRPPLPAHMKKSPPRVDGRLVGDEDEAHPLHGGVDVSVAELDEHGMFFPPGRVMRELRLQG